MISFNPDSNTLSALRSADWANKRVNKAMAQLASGLRINSAADDPAALVISEQLRAQIAGLNQEIENVSATINKYQTVSDSVMGIRSQLTELRTLAIGASNQATNSAAAQEAYQAAADEIVASINDNISSSVYNGKQTLDGSSESMLDLGAMSDVDFGSPESVAAAISDIDQMVQAVDNGLTELGAVQKNELETSLNTLEQTRENLVSSESQLRDADFGEVLSTFVSGMIQEKASLAMLAHSRVSNEMVLSLLSV